MSRTISVNAVDRTSAIRLDSIVTVETAYGGEVGVGGFDLDDEVLGDVTAMKTLTIDESAASPTRAFTGFVGERQLGRGVLGKVENRRQWDASILDLNTCLDDEVFTGSSADRPAETDYARMTWMLTTAALAALGVTAGVLPNTNTVTMDAFDYRGYGPRRVSADCAEAAAKNYFLYNFGSGHKLYYDKQTGTSLSSSARLTSVLADVDNSVTWAIETPALRKEPTRIYSTVVLKYQGGTVTVTDSATVTAFRRREIYVEDLSITSSTLATAKANAYLAAGGSEEQTFTCAVTVPAANLNDIRAGQRIEVKVPHLGISSYTYYRITRRTVSGAPGRGGVSDVRYRLALEFAPDIKMTTFSTPKGGGEEPECGVCTRAAALLGSGMDANLSLGRGLKGMHVYDGTRLEHYNCNVVRTQENASTTSALSLIYHEPGIYTGLLAGDRVLMLDADLGTYGTARWTTADAIAAADVMDIRRCWTVGGGEGWESQTLEATYTPDLTSALYADGKLWVTGFGLDVPHGAYGYIGDSPDGTSGFTNRLDLSSTGVNGLAYDGARYVAAADNGHLFYSDDDGASWNEAVSVPYAYASSKTLYGVAYGASIWVAGGGLSSEVLVTSSDGSSWSTDTAGFSSRINRVRFLNGLFIAVGTSGELATSANGTDWTQRTMTGWSTTEIQDVAYGAGLYVAVGGLLSATSADGATWSAASTISSEAIFGIAFSGLFIVAGDNGLIMRSPDGSSWTVESTPWSNGYLQGIVFGGVWLTAGDSGRIATRQGDALQSRSMVDGSLIASVSLSEPTAQIRRTPNGQHVFVLQGSNSLIRYSRAPALEDTVAITGFDADLNDWNVDDAYNIYRLGSNSLLRFDPAGTQEWTVNLNTLYGYRFPTLMTIPRGTGQQLVTANNKLRVVGYDGGADWTSTSEALLLSLQPATGSLISEKHFGGDSNDGAQAMALEPIGDCLWLAGVAVGTEFETLTLSGTQGWVMTVDAVDEGSISVGGTEWEDV